MSCLTFLLSASRCTYQGKGAFCCTVCVSVSQQYTPFKLSASCMVTLHSVTAASKHTFCLFQCEIMRVVIMRLIDLCMNVNMYRN